MGLKTGATLCQGTLGKLERKVFGFRREIPVLKEQLGAHCNNTIQGRYALRLARLIKCAEEPQRLSILRDEARCDETMRGGMLILPESVCRRWLITDSEGFVCDRENLSSETQCCTAGSQYACGT